MTGLHNLLHPCTRDAREKRLGKWRENEEMEGKWGNGERFTLYISSFSLYFLPRPSVGALKFRKPYKGNKFLSNQSETVGPILLILSADPNENWMRMKCWKNIRIFSIWNRILEKNTGWRVGFGSGRSVENMIGYFRVSFFLSGISGYFGYFRVCRVFSGISGFTHIY